MKKVALAFLLSLLPACAWASCSVTSLTFKDAAGNTQSLCFGGGAGAYIPQSDILGNNGATLDATLSAGTAPANGVAILGQYNSTPPSPSSGQTVALQLDANGSSNVAGACKKVINISQTSSTDVHTFTGYGHICSIILVSATVQSIGVDEGTGTTCETSGTALIGVSSTSAATPQISVSATQGFVATAAQPWLTMQASADHLCVLQSGSGEVAGTITYTDLTNP